jgi:hypothetical protein
VAEAVWRVNPLWTPESDDVDGRLREAEREWKRLKRMGEQQREKERISLAELEATQARDALDSALRQTVRADNAFLEGSKLDHDTFKTQSTLSLSFIAGAAALAGSIFRPNSVNEALLLAVCVVFLLGAVLISLSSMRFIAAGAYILLGSADPDEIDRFSSRNSRQLNRRDRGATGCLFLGVLLFVIYVAANQTNVPGYLLEVVSRLMQNTA